MIQTDIRAFYDHIDVVKAATEAAAYGLPPPAAAAAVRMQLCSGVLVGIPGAQGCPLADRTLGALAGSRTAGALGRWVVRSLARHLWEQRGRTCTRIPVAGPMLVASYVDNLLLMGADASAAAETHRVASEYLARTWELDLPAMSTECVVPRGGVPADPPIETVTCTKFLGHVIGHNASTRSCWRRTRLLVTARAHEQMRVARRAYVPLALRLASLDTVLWPVLVYRAPAWSPTAQLLREADALQRRCAALAMGLRPWPLEDVAAFRRRRGRVAATALYAVRPWSARIVDLSAARLAAYRAESAGESSWAGSIFARGTEAELAERRVLLGSSSVHAGRIGTRIVPGRAVPRWQATVVSAIAARSAR